MKSLKLYLIIGAVIIITSAFVTANILIKQNKKLKSEIERVQTNNFQLMQEKLTYSNLLVKEKEVTGNLRVQRDSLAKALRVKPKFIDKIVYVITTEKDTVVKEVPVYVLGKDRWAVSDTGKCFLWSANITLTDDLLTVKRTGFEYTDSTTTVYYRKRPNKFLWFPVGKRINYVQVSSKCGEAKVESFTFIK